MHTNKMTQQHQCLLQVSCLTNNIKIACHLQAKWNANCDSFLHLQKFPCTSGGLPYYTMKVESGL